MKYSVEVKNGVAKETLIFNGNEYIRTTKTTEFGSESLDMDFSEQMENEKLDSDTLDQVFDVLDGFFVNKGI